LYCATDDLNPQTENEAERAKRRATLLALETLTLSKPLVGYLNKEIAQEEGRTNREHAPPRPGDCAAGLPHCWQNGNSALWQLGNMAMRSQGNAAIFFASNEATRQTGNPASDWYGVANRDRLLAIQQVALPHCWQYGKLAMEAKCSPSRF
jgi:hypothetical protein